MIAGRRRLDRADPVLDLFDRRVTAADLCSPVFAVAAGDRVDDAVAALGARGYGAAPVLPWTPSEPVALFRPPGPFGPARPDGSLAPAGPDGAVGSGATVGEAATPLPGDAVVGLDDPLPQVLAALRRHDLLVVVDRSRSASIVGVITRRDLDRGVAGLAVLGLLVRAEPRLDRLIQREAGGRWEDLLPAARRDKLAAVRTYPERADAELTRLARLNLDDRMTLVRKLPALRARLGWPTTGVYRRFAEPVRDLRDVLAHGGGLLDAGADPVAVIDLVAELRLVVDRIDACLAAAP